MLLKKHKIKPVSIHCSSKSKPGKPSPFLLNEAIKRNKAKINETCFVGDTYIDYTAAKNANVDFIYAKYGYGDKKFNYKKIISSFKKLEEYIRQ